MQAVLATWLAESGILLSETISMRPQAQPHLLEPLGRQTGVCTAGTLRGVSRAQLPVQGPAPGARPLPLGLRTWKEGRGCGLPVFVGILSPASSSLSW